MPPLVYRRLVEMGALTVVDLVRFAGGDSQSDAHLALVLLVEEGTDAIAASAADALHGLAHRVDLADHAG